MKPSAYQRGNRDGLLAFAAWAKSQADLHGADVARCEKVLQNPVNQVQANAAQRIEQNALVRMTAFNQAAEQALRMAESLPLDPESQEEL